MQTQVQTKSSTRTRTIIALAVIGIGLLAAAALFAIDRNNLCPQAEQVVNQKCNNNDKETFCSANPVIKGSQANFIRQQLNASCIDAIAYLLAKENKQKCVNEIKRINQAATTAKICPITKSWNFSNSAEYNFDNTKIELTNNTAQLKDLGRPQDNGWTWLPCPDPNNNPENRYGVKEFLKVGNKIFAARNKQGLLLGQSSDGGLTWNDVNFWGWPDNSSVNDIFLSKEGVFLIMTNRGIFFKSGDQGATWSRLEERIKDPDFPDGDNRQWPIAIELIQGADGVYAITQIVNEPEPLSNYNSGENAINNISLFKWTESNHTWNKIFKIDTEYVGNITSAILKDNFLFVGTAQGKKILKISIPENNPPEIEYIDLRPITRRNNILGTKMINNNETIFMGGLDSPGGQLYKTNNNGEAWERTTDYDSEGWGIEKLYLDEKGNLYINVGHRGEVFKTTDGGETWSWLADNTYDPYRQVVSFVNTEIQEKKDILLAATHQQNLARDCRSIAAYNMPNFDTSIPTISNKDGISYASLQQIVIGFGNYEGDIKFQIGKDGKWYWWNGQNWVETQDNNQINTASDIQSHIKDFNNLGTGKFYWKAFFKSDGLRQAQLKKVELQYKQ